MEFDKEEEAARWLDSRGLRYQGDEEEIKTLSTLLENTFWKGWGVGVGERDTDD